MKALIVSGIVQQIHETGFPVADPWYWVDCPEGVGEGYSYDSDKFIPPPTYTLKYDQLRKYEYPPIAEQLDALWHDMESGKIAGKGKSEWYNKISEVKKQYPKE
jgi:hypothetical protein